MSISFLDSVGLSDEEIYKYCINLKEHVTSRRSTRLPSWSKHGQKFSGTEITLCTYESINNLVAGFTCFLQKVQQASLIFGSVSRVVEGNRWMLCLEISYEHIMLCIHALLAITLPRGWHAVGGLLYIICSTHFLDFWIFTCEVVFVTLVFLVP